MLLDDLGTGWFDVLVFDSTVQDAFLTQGSYLEATRLTLDSVTLTPEELSQAGLISFDYFVTAGTINGPTDYQAHVFGLAVVGIQPGLDPEDPPITIQGFTPLASNETLEDAISTAYTWWKINEYPPPAVAEAPEPSVLELAEYAAALPMKLMPAKPPKPNPCAEQCRLCKTAAWDRCQANKKRIAAQTTVCMGACVLPCGATGPAALICIGVCGGGCIAVDNIRVRAEYDDLNAAYADCDRQKLECDQAHKE